MQVWRNFLFMANTAVVLHLLGGGAGGCSATEAYQGYEGHWQDVVATAYSPVDPIDGAYHATKGAKWRWITADAKTDVRETPYGIAVPLSRNRPALPFGTAVIIPLETGYLSRTVPDRLFRVDDVGNGRQYFKTRNGLLHIDLRFKTHESAIHWAGPEGFRRIRIFVATRKIPPPPPPPAFFMAPAFLQAK